MPGDGTLASSGTYQAPRSLRLRVPPLAHCSAGMHWPAGEGSLLTAHPKGPSRGGDQQDTEGTVSQVGKGRAVSGQGPVTKGTSQGPPCLSPPLRGPASALG